jgi:hypothetical protein
MEIAMVAISPKNKNLFTDHPLGSPDEEILACFV